jgi:Glycosyl transferase family 2
MMSTMRAAVPADDDAFPVEQWQFLAPPPSYEIQPGPPPTFSVVIAAHNAAATIAEAVGSVLAQTVQPHEIIVCDDGSTDHTAVVLEPYLERIVLVRKAHGGAASARNAALARARGDFFVVLDADDAYLPKRLEALTELSVARPDLDILCTDAVVEIAGRVANRFSEGTPFEVSDQRSAILERCFCAAPAIRRTRLVQSGGFDESLHTGSDWECVIRLILNEAVAGIVDQPLYRYRVHERSLTSDRIRTLRDRVALLEHVENGGRELSEGERAVLLRSLSTQRTSLILTEAEAALRAGAGDARSRALAVARAPNVSLRSRTAAVAAALAPHVAARVLERRESRHGRTRLRRVVSTR